MNISTQYIGVVRVRVATGARAGFDAHGAWRLGSSCRRGPRGPSQAGSRERGRQDQDRARQAQDRPHHQRPAPYQGYTLLAPIMSRMVYLLDIEGGSFAPGRAKLLEI